MIEVTMGLAVAGAIAGVVSDLRSTGTRAARAVAEAAESRLLAIR
jgi:hypothetical protein